MNLVLDPGAELGVAWTYSGGALRTDTLPVYAGSWCHQIYAAGPGAFGGPAQGVASQTLDTEPGVPITLSMQVNGDGASAPQVLRLRYDLGAGFVTLAELSDPIGPGFQLWEPGEIVPTGASVVIELRSVIASGATQGIWRVDDVSADDGEEDDMGKRAIYDAVIAALAGINGTAGNYRTNLEGRVYQRYLLPDEAKALGIALPYAILPYVVEPISKTNHGRTIERRWALTAHLFVEDNSDNDKLNTTAAGACADLEDDLDLLSLRTQSLGGVAKNVESVDSRTFVGLVGDTYGEVVARLVFTETVGTGDLAV